MVPMPPAWVAARIFYPQLPSTCSRPLAVALIVIVLGGFI
jgi:hypothetical protein